jgi:hypothetical protein
MATKTNISTSTTNTTINTGGKVKTSSITSETISKRKLSFREQAQGGLSSIARLEMIGITILSIAVGSSVSDFTTSDLIETNPNYQLTNTYVSIDDPLNNVNYQQYGTQVVGNLTAFLGALGGAGNLAKNLWDGITNFIGDSWIETTGSFAAEFGEARWIQVYDHYQKYYEEGSVQQLGYIYYEILTNDEKDFVGNQLNHEDFSPLEKQVFLSERWYLFYNDVYGLFGPIKTIYWWFTEPSVYYMINEGL